jgi:BlaI family transcriptional regulator, penicillinase repressor
MTTTNKPTKAELEILSILWERNPASVRDVYARLNESKPVKYTSVLKTMQIMFEKGMLKRDATAKAHLYRPVQTQRQTQKNLVNDLLDRAFRGSALKLVQHVLETKPASADELAEIKRMISEVEAKGDRK